MPERIRTSLSAIAWSDRADIFHLLLGKGADLEVGTEEMGLLVTIAAGAGNTETLGAPRTVRRPWSGHGSWNTRRWWRVYWPPVSKRGEVPEEPSGAEGPFLFRCLGGHPIQAGLHRRWCMAAAVGRSQLVDVGWSGCRIRLTRRRIQPQALSHSPGDSFVQGRTHAAAMALDLGDEGLDLLPAGLVLHGFRG